ncbi:polyketide synthase docking domain-containing protein, partial [Streptosporangium saharense]|uniref:polyketide synthase docking domain-containing protein n=1 Tax=Streptosporangium saharense TaxID=1706840 RepID=UPI0036966DB0
MATGEDRLRDYLRRATTELHDVRQRLRTAEAELATTGEPVAVIGMGCRFPGGA